jgi:hypothetical protein
MRLFRQNSQGDWPGVFAAMEADLTKRVEAGVKLAAPKIPVSWGELIDKLTILEIKHERITNEPARTNVVNELSFVRAAADSAISGDDRLHALKGRLKAINEKLWRIEDAIRAKEVAGVFDGDFIELARAVYRCNDERSAVKREINVVLGSELLEEKSYTRSQPQKDRT